MSKLKKIAKKVHLWLGLISGIIMFVVCTTACLWVFNEEIEQLTLPDLTVQPVGQLLSPSQLKERVTKEFPQQKIQGIQYRKGELARFTLEGERGKNFHFVNPYTGEVLNVKSSATEFFKFVLKGHRTLWLPREIGSKIVNYGTLMFIMVLLTGFILWMPKSRAGLSKVLSFHWKKETKGRKKLFDLHNVLGFYAGLILLIIGMSGMIFGLNWWSDGVYQLTTGGKSLPERTELKSDTLQVGQSLTANQAVDSLFAQLNAQYPKAEAIQLGFADDSIASSTLSASIFPKAGRYYDRDAFVYDRYTLKVIPQKGPYAGKYVDASFGDKLRRMNYEIHTGSIGGLATKIIAFFAALIGASLPVTGLMLWLRRTKSKR